MLGRPGRKALGGSVRRHASLAASMAQVLGTDRQRPL